MADSLIDSIRRPCRPWAGHADRGVSGQAFGCVALSQVVQLSGSTPGMAGPRPLLTRRRQDKLALTKATRWDAEPPTVTGQARGQYIRGVSRERKGLSGSEVLGGARADPHNHTGAPGSGGSSCLLSYPGPAPTELGLGRPSASDSVS